MCSSDLVGSPRNAGARGHHEFTAAPLRHRTAPAHAARHAADAGRRLFRALLVCGEPTVNRRVVLRYRERLLGTEVHRFRPRRSTGLRGGGRPPPAHPVGTPTSANSLLPSSCFSSKCRNFSTVVSSDTHSTPTSILLASRARVRRHRRCLLLHPRPSSCYSAKTAAITGPGDLISLALCDRPQSRPSPTTADDQRRVVNGRFVAIHPEEPLEEWRVLRRRLKSSRCEFCRNPVTARHCELDR